jgi:hypothetical protein
MTEHFRLTETVKNIENEQRFSVESSEGKECTRWRFEIHALTPPPPPPFLPQLSSQDRVFLGKILVHAADISNPCLPHFEQVEKWANLIVAEFTFQVNRHRRFILPAPVQFLTSLIFPTQVAQEREKNIPISTFMDGLDNPESVAKLQVNFISYIVQPLWNALSDIFGDLCVCTNNLEANKGIWASR